MTRASGQIFHILNKRCLVTMALVFWVLIFFYALIKNPSLHESNVRISIMRSDTSTALEDDRIISYKYENSKYGSALLYVRIFKKDWTPQVRQASIDNFINLGWKPRKPSLNSFCKNGMLMDIQENPGSEGEIPIILISMTYNASTIKICRIN
ncbi:MULTISPECIES: hypothetical protein [Pandoraea]|uniref:hypothetical protein n=1 Tax=Pandoraea TaxID=93217 RepID=UPI001F5D3CAD|nr:MULTISPECIES: hypothetical protein [Pandoraea]